MYYRLLKLGEIQNIYDWQTMKYAVMSRAAERGEQLASGTKQVGAPNLRNILKLNN